MKRGIPVLGLLTICTYGVWYYSFGVLLEPIHLDTGWSESSLTASFSAGTVLVGLTALAGGRLLDRFGERLVFFLGGVCTGGALLLASVAGSAAVFFVSSAFALGASGALGFYHVTMSTAVRLHPDDGDRAIAQLTVWGAFASAIFLPVVAWLVQDMGWRVTVRLLALAGTSAFFGAAVLVPTIRARSNKGADEAAGGGSPQLSSLSTVVRRAVAAGPPRWLTFAIGFGGIAMSTMLVYQVPVMVAAGLPATAAATVAGLRGLAQLSGRLPLTPIVQRLGADRALQLAFSAMTIGGLTLLLADNLAVGVIFALTAGFGIGAFSPLQGMRAAQLFDQGDLGATMGFYGATLLFAGSVGPVGAGIISDVTGDRRWVVAIIVVASLAALWSVDQLRRAAAMHDDHASESVSG